MKKCKTCDKEYITGRKGECPECSRGKKKIKKPKVIQLPPPPPIYIPAPAGSQKTYYTFEDRLSGGENLEVGDTVVISQTCTISKVTKELHSNVAVVTCIKLNGSWQKKY